MEDQVNRLVNKTWNKYRNISPDRRLLIAISGIPGSGKTTLAALVVHRLNGLSPSPIAAYIPMDGYHLSRAQLSALPDPISAHARRGAAFTFDGESFLTLVQHLREPLTASSKTFYAPSFDHALKDPVIDDVPILPTARIIVFEGLYLSLNKYPWNAAARLMDELWFVDVDFEVARRRLVERHVKTGVTRDAEEAARRADENDLVNGMEIVEDRLPIDEVIVSMVDKGWELGRVSSGSKGQVEVEGWDIADGSANGEVDMVGK